jgi:uncharacterized membrane protein YcaP (DUF421 family)
MLMSWASFLWPWAERVLEGEPRVIVRHGEVLRANLRRHRLTMSEIESEMRLAGIGRLSDVAWAILEPRGKISFIQRSDGGHGNGTGDDEEPPQHPASADEDGAV